jgi:hypothetical protein
MLKVAMITTIAFCLSGCMTAAEQQAAAQAEARAVAAQDDATCRSYGAKPGTNPYIACRMNIANQRAADERQQAANDDALAAAWILSRH